MYSVSHCWGVSPSLHLHSYLCFCSSLRHPFSGCPIGNSDSTCWKPTLTSIPTVHYVILILRRVPSSRPSNQNLRVTLVCSCVSVPHLIPWKVISMESWVFQTYPILSLPWSFHYLRQDSSLCPNSGGCLVAFHVSPLPRTFAVALFCGLVL